MIIPFHPQKNTILIRKTRFKLDGENGNSGIFYPGEEDDIPSSKISKNNNKTPNKIGVCKKSYVSGEYTTARLYRSPITKMANLVPDMATEYGTHSHSKRKFDPSTKKVEMKVPVIPCTSNFSNQASSTTMRQEELPHSGFDAPSYTIPVHTHHPHMYNKKNSPRKITKGYDASSTSVYPNPGKDTITDKRVEAFTARSSTRHENCQSTTNKPSAYTSQSLLKKSTVPSTSYTLYGDPSTSELCNNSVKNTQTGTAKSSTSFLSYLSTIQKNPQNIVINNATLTNTCTQKALHTSSAHFTNNMLCGNPPTITLPDITEQKIQNDTILTTKSPFVTCITRMYTIPHDDIVFYTTSTVTSTYNTIYV